jgi:hypothetical protein
MLHMRAVRSEAVLGAAVRAAALAALVALSFAQGCAAPGAHTAAIAQPIKTSELDADAIVARAIAEHEMRRP